MPLGTKRPTPPPREQVGGYFIEEVRRELMGRYGENDKDSPNSVYAGGLWVRTSLDPIMQAAAADALRNGLVRYDNGKGWTGPSGSIGIGEGWPRRLAVADIGYGLFRIGLPRLCWVNPAAAHNRLR